MSTKKFSAHHALELSKKEKKSMWQLPHILDQIKYAAELKNTSIMISSKIAGVEVTSDTYNELVKLGYDVQTKKELWGKFLVIKWNNPTS